jgi:hypothetical protein
VRTGRRAQSGKALIMEHTIVLDESERQAVLLALAKLSLERPGWDDMLNRIALKMDNASAGRAQMYDSFRALGLESMSDDGERRNPMLELNPQAAELARRARGWLERKKRAHERQELELRIHLGAGETRTITWTHELLELTHAVRFVLVAVDVSTWRQDVRVTSCKSGPHELLARAAVVDATQLLPLQAMLRPDWPPVSIVGGQRELHLTLANDAKTPRDFVLELVPQ